MAVFLSRRWQQTWWNHFGTPATCQHHLLILREGTLVGGASIFYVREPLLYEGNTGAASRPARGEARHQGIASLSAARDFMRGADVSQNPTIWSASGPPCWPSLPLETPGTPSISRSLFPTGALPRDTGYLSCDLAFKRRTRDVRPAPSSKLQRLGYHLMSLRRERDRHELRRKVPGSKGAMTYVGISRPATVTSTAYRPRMKPSWTCRAAGEQNFSWTTTWPTTSSTWHATCPDTGWLDLAIPDHQ